MIGEEIGFLSLWDTSAQAGTKEIIQILFDDYVKLDNPSNISLEIIRKMINSMLRLKSYHNITILLDKIYEWKPTASMILDIRSIIALIEFLGCFKDYERSFKLIFELKDANSLQYQILLHFKGLCSKARHFALAQEVHIR